MGEPFYYCVKSQVEIKISDVHLHTLKAIWHDANPINFESTESLDHMRVDGMYVQQS